MIGSGSIAVAVARSLGRAGLELHGWGDGYGPARDSRFWSTYTDVRRRGGDVGDRLWQAAIEGPRRGLIIPCTDDGVEFVALRGSELEDLGYELPQLEPEVSLALLDKHSTYALAEELGVPAPRTAISVNGRPPDPLAAGIAFPCGLKPLHSHRFARYFDGRDPRAPKLTKLFVVDGPEELATAWQRTSKLGLEMLLTELVPGPDSELFSYLAHIGSDGRPQAELTFRKLRQYPARYGLASYTIGADFPEVAEAGRKLLAGIGLRGCAHVEFKRSPEGTLKLLECNPRLTIELRHATTDLPRLMYEQSTGRGLPRTRRHRPVRRLWDPIPDFRSLGERDSRAHTSLRRWAGGIVRGVGFHVFDLRDPRPTLGYHRRIGLRHARRLSKLRHRSGEHSAAIRAATHSLPGRWR